MNDTHTSTWHARNASLIAHLERIGVLTDPRWREAFRATPRHVFVPRFYDDSGTLISDDDPATRDEWLYRVYSDATLVVQRAPAGYDREISSSSSTKPSMMARMLELLAVDDGNQVLEIGTATGYNAALLSHRLGDGNVTSIELHPELAQTAREHLAALDQYPTVHLGNGAAGHPDRAPFDRIIATCAANTIPPAWIRQLRTGGRIVTDLRSEISSSLAVLVKSTPETVTGHLLEQPGQFMWLRPDATSPLLHPTKPEVVVDYGDDNTITSETAIDVRVLTEPGLRTIIGIAEPTIHAPLAAFNTGTGTYFLYTDDAAWCEVTTTGTTTTVRQGGPRHVWSSIEQAVKEWTRLGQPRPGRYGLTVTADRHHTYWLDHPEHPIHTVSRSVNM